MPEQIGLILVWTKASEPEARTKCQRDARESDWCRLIHEDDLEIIATIRKLYG